MDSRKSISIKELHAKTGARVRQAGAARSPIQVTDHGRLVAVLASPHLLPPKRARRTLLPEYAALLARHSSTDVLDDLNAIRGSR